MYREVTSAQVAWLREQHRFTTYIGAASLYLRENFFLDEPLLQDHIKSRILGHWGTVPGLNLIYGAINILIQNSNQSTLFITGPGHGAPAILAQLFLEGTLTNFYPEYDHTKNGAGKLIHDFSWPKKFPSHTYPGLPGSIHEGGELGYSLGTAFGAAFDNPELMAVAVIGDGEAETGALAASWQSNKFWNPVRDGYVLPIVHINGYKISNPAIFATMSREELEHYFIGLGYKPFFVSQYESNDIFQDTAQAVLDAYETLEYTRATWSEGTRPLLPVVLLKTMKGWTGPAYNGAEKLEDSNYSHGIPLKNPKTDDEEFKVLKNWLESYKPQFLFKSGGGVEDKFTQCIPQPSLRIGANPSAQLTQPQLLQQPDLTRYAETVRERGQVSDSELEKFGEYLVGLMKEEKNHNNFRVFSPDESESNKQDPVLESVKRPYMWPLREWDKFFSPSGRFMEILSEQTLQSWMQGYVMTGRHGVLISYEAFLSIIASQIDQYIKFLRQSKDFAWRKEVPSMNYIATSSVWRQDHNGFTHQNPILINTILAKYVDFAHTFFPVDVNTMLVTMEHVFGSTSTVNLVVAGKTDMPQWLTLEEARQQVQKGLSVWSWASTESTGKPDVVLASIGDYQTLETMAAIDLLKQHCPELRIRHVNISHLSMSGIGAIDGKPKTKDELNVYFTNDRNIVLNFHGYPEAIYQLRESIPILERMTVLGYREKGTTTTPFDMQVKNGTSRYHVAILALEKASEFNIQVAQQYPKLRDYFESKIAEHKVYIEENGEDMPEIKNWKWKN